MSTYLNISKYRPGIDLRNPQIQRDPFPTYTLMRNKYPVCQVEPGIWAISRFSDVQYALKRHDLFSSSANNILFDSDWLNSECRNQRLIAAQDPPDHTKYQSLLKRSFLKSVIKDLTPLMRDTLNSIFDECDGDKKIEFVEQVAFPFIGKIVRHLTGIDEYQGLAELREWVTLEGTNSPTRPSSSYIKKFEHAVARQNGYFLKVIESRRKMARQDLVTELVNAKIDNEYLSDMQLCSIMSLIVSAAFIGTVQSLNHCIIQLSHRPALFQQLAQSPQLIPNFIDETLRFCTPAHSAFRKTTCEIELSGITIPKDECVLILLASANRDPQEFSNPDTFDIHRPKPNHHLAFGYGVHTCLGAALGKTEIRIALEIMLDKFDSISCPSETSLDWLDSGFMRGVNSLPITVS